MLRKIVTLFILILLVTLLVQYYSIHQGSVIILTQTTKITINLAMAILIVVIGFLALHYCLRFIGFLRSSSSTWKRYRQDRSEAKHQKNRHQALLHQLNDEHAQAEYLFKQGYLANTKKNILDLLLAVQAELNNEQAPRAQNDLSEVFSKDPEVKEAINYLQAKIYQQKNQPKSAIVHIKQDRNYLKKPHLMQQLCNCLINSEQYHELLEVTNLRSALNSDQKQNWCIQAHQGILNQYLSKHQIPEALRYYSQIPTYISKAPEIVAQYLYALFLNSDTAQMIKTIDKNFTALMTDAANQSLIRIIESNTQRDLQSKIETLLNQYLTKINPNKANALRCRAHLFTQKQFYEKAIADYQALINLGLSPEETLAVRITICQLEKKTKHKTKQH